MTDAVTRCPRCEHEVTARTNRCPACGFDLKHYRRLISARKTAPVWPDVSVEEIKRALLADTRRQAILDKIYFIGSAVLTVGVAWINLTSGAFGPAGQIDFMQFAESVTSLVVPLSLIWLGLRTISLIFNLPYVWQLLIKIAEQQAEVLIELRRSRSSEPTPPEP